MAFAQKTDFCGLSAVDANILLRDDNENGSQEKYQPTGQKGQFCDLEVYGEDAAPTNNYAIKSDLDLDDGDIKIGAIKTIGEGAAAKKYALESFEIGTSGGSVPTLSATSQLVESDADASTMPYAAIPAFKLRKRHHAQILFDAFTLTGADCELTSCNARGGGTIGKDKLVGVPIGSDVNSVSIVVSGTILQIGDTAPTLTPATGWKVTQKPTCTNPETAKKEYAFELEKNIEIVDPGEDESSSSSSSSSSVNT